VAARRPGRTVRPLSGLSDLLQRFEARPPAVVFEWHDSLTEAEGWVVINSLRGGAAGGGTRMRLGLNKHEVLSLAKTMEIKFTVSGPPIGGAKSGINFDPADPRKYGVLQRWYQAVTPLLKSYYGTGGDLNVDEINEVVPLTELLGLWHPQEGIVQGHFHPTDQQKVQKLGQLRTGVPKVIEDAAYSPCLLRKYRIADMITGYGVSESVRQLYALWGRDMAGQRAVIQGWGNVGAAAGFYLAQSGVKVVGIIDRHGGVVDPNGFSPAEVTQFFLDRDGMHLRSDRLVPYAELMGRVWDVGAEIFVPCASSRLVDRTHLHRLLNGGLQVIVPGANVPFNDPEIFMGPTSEFADQNASCIPDFIANCGMARVFAYLMGSSVELTDKAIFADCSRTIGAALQRVHDLNPQHTGITTAAYRIALQELM
jgi:glutamate dehydrogenase/leucine dehydrogenase